MANEAEKEWAKFQGISKEDFLAKGKAGEFDKFLNDPGFMEASNTGKLFEKTVEKLVEKPIEKPIESAAEKPTVVPAPTPEVPPVKDGHKWWEKEGYATEEETAIAHTNLRELVDKKQAQINRDNAEKGRLVKENQRIAQLELELKRVREERVNASLTAQTGVDIPDIPVAPVPVDGDFGSPEYKAARTDYETRLKAYNEKVRTAFASEREEKLKFRNELTEVKGKTVKLETETQESTAERQRKADAEQWTKTMDQVAKLQEHDQTLKTSKAFNDINSFVRGHGLEEAKKVFPAKDLENYDHICEVIKTAYPVDDNGNVDFAAPKYKNLKMAHYAMLDDLGKLDERLHSIQTQGERKGREQVIKAIEDGANHARPLPVGGTQGEIINEITDSDLEKDLAEISKPEYAHLWKSTNPEDAEKQKWIYGVLSKKAEKNPEIRSAIPTAWVTRFEKKG